MAWVFTGYALVPTSTGGLQARSIWTPTAAARTALPFVAVPASNPPQGPRKPDRNRRRRRVPKFEAGVLTEELERLVHMAYQGVRESREAQQAIVEHPLDLQDLKTLVKFVNVQAAISSPFANYFLQELVVQYNRNASTLIVGELESIDNRHMAWTACHRFGCRLLCRLAERVVPSTPAEAYLQRLLQNNELVFYHKFGKHVVITCLASPSPLLSQTCMNFIRKNKWEMAGSEHSRFVLEEAVVMDKDLALELAKDQGRLLKVTGSHMSGRFLRSAVQRMKRLFEGQLEV